MRHQLFLLLLRVVHFSVTSTFRPTHKTRADRIRIRCRSLESFDELDQDPLQLFIKKFQESLDSLSFTKMVLSQYNEDDNIDDDLKGCKEVIARTIKVKKSDIMCQLTFKYDSYTHTKNLNYSESPKYVESLFNNKFKKAILATTKSDFELKLIRGKGKLKETLKV